MWRYNNMVIKFDSKKASSGFAVLPAGKYEAFVDGGQFKTASTGSPMINWKFKIRNDVDQEGKGRIIFNNLVFNAKTEGMVHGFLKAIGAPDGMEFNDYQDIINYATGKAILINLKVTQYKGEDQNNVSWVEASTIGGGRVDNPFGEAAPATADPFANTDIGDPFAGQPDPFATGAYTPPAQTDDEDAPF